VQGKTDRTRRISAAFNAPLTGVFFGVEIILREFSIEGGSGNASW
jgi:H+/Cl- antiporter ClcA